MLLNVWNGLNHWASLYNQINDAIVGATGGPDIASGLASWYGKTATESLMDAEARWLIAQGATPGHIQDMWVEVFGPGEFNDVYFEYWRNQ